MPFGALLSSLGFWAAVFFAAALTWVIVFWERVPSPDQASSYWWVPPSE